MAANMRLLLIYQSINHLKWNLAGRITTTTTVTVAVTMTMDNLSNRKSKIVDSKLTDTSLYRGTCAYSCGTIQYTHAEIPTYVTVNTDGCSSL